MSLTRREFAQQSLGGLLTYSLLQTLFAHDAFGAETKLLAAKGVPGSKIEVDTTNGIVTLKGTVPTHAARTKAVRITRGSKGVKHVVNQLTIGAS